MMMMMIIIIIIIIIENLDCGSRVKVSYKYQNI